jgi:hypothetical protein
LNPNSVLVFDRLAFPDFRTVAAFAHAILVIDLLFWCLSYDQHARRRFVYFGAAVLILESLLVISVFSSDATPILFMVARTLFALAMDALHKKAEATIWYDRENSGGDGSVGADPSLDHEEQGTL